MKRTDKGAGIPDWKCERYLLGELDAAEMERIELQSRHDAELRNQLAELERSTREILARHPAGPMARQIERRLAAATGPASGSSVRRLIRFAWVPVGLAAAVALFLLFDPGILRERGITGRDANDNPSIRIKGPAAELSLYRRTESGSENLENGAVAAEHDLILARYRAAEQTWGLILSVDGRGILTLHHTEWADQAVRMAAGTHSLEFSYELDDAPLWEIFLLASADEPFAGDTVIDAVVDSPLVQTPGLPRAEAEAILRSLVLPEGVALTTFTLIKADGHE